MSIEPVPTETERLHAEILEGKAEISKLRDLLRAENQRANSAIDRETTAEQAATEAQEEVRRLGLMVDEYGAGASALTDKLRRVRDLHRETCVVAQGVILPPVASCGLCEVLDAPAVPVSPPTDQTALRDRIAEALYRREWPRKQIWQQALAMDREVFEAMADAVLAVLPEPADRGAVLREAAGIAESLRRFEPATGARKSAQVSENVGILRVAEELRRLAAEAPTATKPETEAVCVCGHPTRQHFEDACLLTGCGCADALEISALPEALEAVLTKRFTELGNPFSRMSRSEQGPDGWPASHPVGPHHVAEALRELLAAGVGQDGAQS